MTRVCLTLLLGDVVTRLENKIGIILADDDIILDADCINLLLALGVGRQAGGVLSDADSVEQMRAAKGEPLCAGYQTIDSPFETPFFLVPVSKGFLERIWAHATAVHRDTDRFGTEWK